MITHYVLPVALIIASAAFAKSEHHPVAASDTHAGTEFDRGVMPRSELAKMNDLTTSSHLIVIARLQWISAREPATNGAVAAEGSVIEPYQIGIYVPLRVLKGVAPPVFPVRFAVPGTRYTAADGSLDTSTFAPGQRFALCLHEEYWLLEQAGAVPDVWHGTLNASDSLLFNGWIRLDDRRAYRYVPVKQGEGVLPERHTDIHSAEEELLRCLQRHENPKRVR